METTSSQFCKLDVNYTENKEGLEKCKQNTECAKDDRHKTTELILQESKEQLMQQDSPISETNDSNKHQLQDFKGKPDLESGTSQRLNTIGILVNSEIQKRFEMSEVKSDIIREELTATKNQIIIMERRFSPLFNSESKTKQALDKVSKQMFEKFTEMKNEFTKSRDQLLIQMEDGFKKIQEEMQKELSEIRNELNVVEENQKLSDVTVSLTSKQIQEQLENLDQISKENKNQLASMNSELVFLSANRSGAIIWRIGGWTEKMKDAKDGKTNELSSPGFYLSQYGYKIKMLLSPNGQQDGEGTHVSVFMRLVHGEFDSILSWPFKLRCKLSLLDQTTDNAKHIFGIAMPTSEQVNSWKRPDKTDNLGRGFDKFASHEQLNFRKFIVDDTIFIKFEIIQ